MATGNVMYQFILDYHFNLTIVMSINMICIHVRKLCFAATYIFYLRNSYINANVTLYVHPVYVHMYICIIQAL